MGKNKKKANVGNDSSRDSVEEDFLKRFEESLRKINENVLGSRSDNVEAQLNKARAETERLKRERIRFFVKLSDNLLLRNPLDYQMMLILRIILMHFQFIFGI